MYKHQVQFLLLITVFLSVSCAQMSNTDTSDSNAYPTVSPIVAIAKAEALYKERADIDKVRQAITALEQARNLDNRNYEVEWKFAQMSYFLGSRKIIKDDEANKILSKGLEAAKIAKRMEPNKADGHFWYAGILGEQSKRNPITVGVASVSKIRESMNKVIEIDENYQGASAFDGLGQLEMGTRGLAGGSAEKAVEYLEKALKLNGENSYIRLHLGEAYLAVKKKEQAKKHLNYVLSMTPHPDFLPEHAETVEQAKKLLKEKF